MSAPTTITAGAGSGRAQLGLDALLDAYRTGEATPSRVLAEVVAAADDGDPAIWIDRIDADTIARRCAELEATTAGPDRLPLYGIPFAVKDNIDVAGRPTTAACPDFARVASRSAPAVVALERAGAVLVGKTNLDQFATGLVGTRSPYGVPINPHAADHVPGGSSSGSAVAVAGGLVSFALGTDTAGSGRVPAAMTGTVGLKPTRGIVSTSGVVPACRSLDCVSVFAVTPSDADRVLDVLDVFDAEDSHARRPGERMLRPADEITSLRVGVPRIDGIQPALAAAFATHVAELRELGLAVVSVDLASFERAGRLLYDGPWLAERLAGLASFVAEHPDALLDVTRRVLEGGGDVTGAEVFEAVDELASLRRSADMVFAEVDVVVLPSVPMLTTLADVAADPIGANARLGRFTNFVNLLDLAAVAVPAGLVEGVPVGFTVLGPALTDRTLLALAAAYRAQANGGDLPERRPRGRDTLLAVVGAHLRGQPLHHQLVAAGARLVERTTTDAAYRLVVLPAQEPPRPGLVPAADGATIEVEVYELPAVQVEVLRAAASLPLTIGPVRLADGREVVGYRCDAPVDGAQDITASGGWRAHLAGLRHVPAAHDRPDPIPTTPAREEHP